MPIVKFIGLALAAAAALAATGAPAQAQEIYGALAISTSTGVYGYSYNYTSPAQASARAMSECTRRTQSGDCKVYATFQRQCIAVAYASNKVFAWALGYAADERNERALNECAARNGGDCKIVARFCSGTRG